MLSHNKSVPVLLCIGKTGVMKVEGGKLSSFEAGAQIAESRFLEFFVKVKDENSCDDTCNYDGL